MKLRAMLCRATQEEQVVVKSSDKMWSTGEGNGNHTWTEEPGMLQSMGSQRVAQKKAPQHRNSLGSNPHCIPTLLSHLFKAT